MPAIPASKQLTHSLCAKQVGMNLTLSQRNFGMCFTGFLV